MEGSNNDNFELWLDKNLNDQVGGNSTNFNWSILFAAAIWNIWKRRNGFQYNDFAIIPDHIVIKSRILAKEILKAFTNNYDQVNSQNGNLIKWKFPNAGSFKINTDGSLGQGDRGSFGGLMRDDQGKWVEGFCGNIEWSTVIKAELWAIRYALYLCDERNWEGAPIETDCLTAVKLIKGDIKDNHHPTEF